MSRTRIKICGLTRVEDTQLACDLGADAIGLNFYPGSKRFLTLEQARRIRASIPAFVSAVGLFVNPERSEVESVLEALHLDCLQFHGDESPGFCRSFALPYMKVIRVREGLDIKEEISKYSDSSAILLDSYDKNAFGGTGLRFDWEVARRCVQDKLARIVLAGGLRADNVAAAIAQVQPYAVDVSSGVESAPGVKDTQCLKAFFDEVNRV
ncbi:MAG: phosphoribosylanthranilate isomerase [Pseudomonadales bacterium]|nr:phosphoribosylanthranilate isomerase [Pseudomonadales bacterium]MCP5331605.1 phosphoribosylanthranilate isomerase [Pseudomonadales bacterium]MCP5344764.1 phosphoribosylanthranilate isomerase [Pseudomonadales bacterium]